MQFNFRFALLGSKLHFNLCKLQFTFLHIL
jgi:hypothetical protein